MMYTIVRSTEEIMKIVKDIDRELKPHKDELYFYHHQFNLEYWKIRSTMVFIEGDETPETALIVGLQGLSLAQDLSLIKDRTRSLPQISNPQKVVESILYWQKQFIRHLTEVDAPIILTEDKLSFIPIANSIVISHESDRSYFPDSKYRRYIYDEERLTAYMYYEPSELIHQYLLSCTS